MNQVPTDSLARPTIRARFITFCGKQWPRFFLHAAAGLLLYRLLTLLFRSGLWTSNCSGSIDAGALTAFLISAIWMVHPVHSAAIDYISGRADSLAFLF